MAGTASLSRYETAYQRLAMPTLIIWGDEDRALHVSSIEVMQPLLRKPSVTIMADTGHAPMIERPQETAEHYRAFLQAQQN